MEDLKELKKFCAHLAEESGKIIRSYWRTDIKVDRKSDLSPVTIADKKSEEIMRELIMKEYPEHGILGEEFGEYKSESEYQWVLDPIDGTKSFICGTITFGTLIALMKNKEPILGVINQPILNEFLLGDNNSTLLNGNPVHVRNCEKISDAVLLSTDILDIEEYQNKKGFDSLMHQVKLFRMWGDCYGYSLVATGYADIMMDPIMNPWDFLALIPILKGAGGTVTDYQGNDPLKGNSLVATGGIIHQTVIEIINQ